MRPCATAGSRELLLLAGRYLAPLFAVNAPACSSAAHSIFFVLRMHVEVATRAREQCFCGLCVDPLNPGETWRKFWSSLHKNASLRMRRKPTILTVGPGSMSSQALARAWIVGTRRLKVPKTSPRVRYRVRWSRRGLPPTSSIG